MCLVVAFIPHFYFKVAYLGFLARPWPNPDCLAASCAFQPYIWANCVVKNWIWNVLSCRYGLEHENHKNMIASMCWAIRRSIHSSILSYLSMSWEAHNQGMILSARSKLIKGRRKWWCRRELSRGNKEFGSSHLFNIASYNLKFINRVLKKKQTIWSFICLSVLMIFFFLCGSLQHKMNWYLLNIFAVQFGWAPKCSAVFFFDLSNWAGSLTQTGFSRAMFKIWCNSES